ncbi:MAG: NUDIX domain-containing protein [Proteobacteria bacterium]|nr:NUDIX domain-containing protein [Pseudomonadota bacterium]
MSSNQGPVVGVGVLIWQGKKLLLGERISKGVDAGSCWQFPGGHLETGETVTQCARREVLEETGLQLTALRHLGFTDQQFDVGQRKYITLLISSEYTSGEAKALEPDKCKSWQWFDYSQLPSPLFLPIKLFLSQYDDLYDLHRRSVILPVD